MPYFIHDSIEFHYRLKGAGIPLAFQHGLGADSSQPFELLGRLNGIRLLSLDCRAHGRTHPVGPVTKLTISSYADDLAALLDKLQIERAIVGGISLGAAVALSFALREPSRVAGVVISRPAWSFEPNSGNAERFKHVADLLREYGPHVGKSVFASSSPYQTLKSVSPDAAVSLLGQFDSPYCFERVARLEQVFKATPSWTPESLQSIQVPVLILAHGLDPIHDYQHGARLATAIPSSEFCEITPKSVSQSQHAADVRGRIGRFLERHFHASSPTDGVLASQSMLCEP